MMRQPIIAVLGHVDHGKTSLLDTIRNTAIASKEAGGITQAIGTTEIPVEIVNTLCGPLMKRFNFQVSVPGLLFIDTPGHEAFTTLRKRGGTIADLAVLVVDLLEGVMPQTEESIQILKDSKTPFLIAVNKIDRLHGWESKSQCFLDNFPQQNDDMKGEFEKRFYEVTEQIARFGYSVDRYDRVTDFRKTVAAVPVSAKTGEGISDLLVTLVGLAQTFLKDQLLTTDQSKGVVLEVKEFKGLGTGINVIVYDGIMKKNDFVVVGGELPRIAKIRTLLMPEPLRDIRTEKKFNQVEEARAACGAVIIAPGLDDVVSGVQVRTAQTMEEAQRLYDEIEKEKEVVEITTEDEGLILKSDTIGGLEALISIFKKHPIKEATIGQIGKKDVISAEANKNMFYRIVIGFNTHAPEEVATFAKDKNIKVLESDVIYHTHEDYEHWVESSKEEIKKKELGALVRPGKMRIMPGLVFRASNPAIVGCEIMGGIVKPGYNLFKYVGKVIKEAGTIKQIQQQGQNVEEAKISDKVAVSILGPTVGRQIDEGDILYTDLNGEDYKKLIKNLDFLTEHEKQVLEEIFNIKKRDNPKFGF
jgi:translation initiation factor 5B